MMTASPKTAAVQGYWEHFPHDADVGLRGFGPTREIAFTAAARGLTAAITDPAAVEPKQRIQITASAPDDEFLFIEWLNALIYEMATRRMLFSRFNVQPTTGGISAEAWGEPVDVERHQPAAEVKGATLTMLEVKKQPDGQWRAQCVIDV